MPPNLKALLLTLILASLSPNSNAIQSNNTCAPIPRDRRQLVCSCAKQLQLRCTFNLDIKEIDPKDMDKSLKSTFYADVALDRLANPDDPDDLNTHFKQSLKKSSSKVYLYFPNFSLLGSPYTRVSLLRFMYVPSFAFSDKALYKPNGEDAPKRFISSVVFELQEIYDFGIDRLAFYGLESEQLIIEGPFNQMSVHREAFFSSKLDELTIGCYCVECETFVGDCRINFNQASIQATFPYESIQNGDETSTIRSLKLYGVQLGDTVYNKWNLDDVPGVNKLERLEISNSIRTVSASSRRQSSGELANSIELKSSKNANFPGVLDFYFR